MLVCSARFHSVIGARRNRADWQYARRKARVTSNPEVMVEKPTSRRQSLTALFTFCLPTIQPPGHERSVCGGLPIMPFARRRTFPLSN